ncbi:MAG: DUF86 domain-containing protein [Anaerolineaceae bacterium]|nr:DUF86 domain-containing protein [Anaerolineaceae bacterium]
MSPRRWEDRIQDILGAINEILSFVGTMEFKDFQNDAKTMRAIELDLILIGEAANAIPEQVQDTYPQIPWHLMRGMRNRLVHTYFEVSPRVLWDTIQQDLPPMVKLLEDLINK